MSENSVYKVGSIKPVETYEVVHTNESKGTINASLLVTLRITEACDLKCSYCFWNDGKHYHYDDIITSIDRLFEFFQRQKISSVRFYYHGGEATRHPRVVDILKYIKQKGEETNIRAYNEMQTNLTIKTHKLEEILKYSDQLNVTFHYTELKNKAHKLKHFNDNWAWMVEHGVAVHNFDVMMEPISPNELNEFYTLVNQYMEYTNIENSEMIYEFGYKFNNYESYNEQTSTQHRSFYEKYNKTEQQYRVDGVLYTTNDFWKHGLNCVGWHCDAGKASFTVNGDGNVYNCGIHMTYHTKHADQETPYTNLVTDKLATTKLSIMYKSGTICRWAYCGGDYYFGRRKLK